MTPQPSPERWRTVGPLLDELLDLEPTARRQFLDQRCGTDRALREELTELMRDCERGEGLLKTSAVMAFAPMLAEPPIALPAVLDHRYHLVREIARGGMATVYLADDPKHTRRVAVKVLHC